MTTLAARVDRGTDFGRHQYVSSMVSADPEDYASPRPSFQWPDSQTLSRPSRTEAVVLNLVEDGCRLRMPITVSIDWENGAFYVENASLGHFGIGDTVEQAVRDLFHSMCVVYAAYRDTPEDRLDPGAKELLATHERVLERVA